MRWLLGDRFLWGASMSLAMIGLLVVYSATVSLVLRHHPQVPEYYLIKHFLALLVAFTGAYAAHQMDYRRWGPIMELIWWGSILLLAYLFFRGGAQRWIYIGGLSLQPSELARFSLVGLIAYRRAQDPALLTTWERLTPVLWRVGLTFLLIAPHNLSGGLLLIATCLLCLYIIGLSLRKVLQIIAVGCIGLLVLVMTAPRAKVWRERLQAYLSRNQLSVKDGGDDYQRVHASLAVYSGGLLGNGPGRSTQRYYLPQSYSDFAYSILIEEYGFFGGVLVLLLFGLYFWRMILLATASDGFARFFTIGFFIHTFMQFLVHIGVNLEIFPITGVPLPWISLGGTSMLVQSIGLGILLGISRRLT